MPGTATGPFRTAFAQCHAGDTADNARNAVRHLKHELGDAPASVVLYFASTDYHPETLAQSMQAAFPNARTIGASAAGEQSDSALMNRAVVAMAFGPEVFSHCRFALVVDGQPVDPCAGIVASTDEAMAQVARGIDTPLLDLDYRKYVGVFLGDCISAFTEGVLERIGEVTDVIFVGGFAGDDYKFTGDQYVFYNGHAYRSAAVIGLWQPKNGFELLKTQAVNLTGHIHTITKADEDKRIIWELDGQPATTVYAHDTGIPEDTMGIFDFDEYPFALMSDGEPFLRAIVQPCDGGMRLFASVREGTRLALSRAGDVLATTAEAFKAKRARMDKLSAIVHFNCASRSTALRNRDQSGDFGSLFAGVPSIAFSSYGEVYVGIVAMTSTMILFR